MFSIRKDVIPTPDQSSVIGLKQRRIGRYTYWPDLVCTSEQNDFEKFFRDLVLM